jgi:hypothetical protein
VRVLARISFCAISLASGEPLAHWVPKRREAFSEFHPLLGDLIGSYENALVSRVTVLVHKLSVMCAAPDDVVDWHALRHVRTVCVDGATTTVSARVRTSDHASHRPLAFVASFMFHCLNKLIFNIGIFPWVMSVRVTHPSRAYSTPPPRIASRAGRHDDVL